MQRRVLFAELRPECREQYIEAHRNVWPELLERYRQIGYHRITCHLLGNLLTVIMEAEDLAAVDLALGDDPINARWQDWMNSLRPPGNEFRPTENVFDVTF